jgi:hypothetical protein
MTRHCSLATPRSPPRHGGDPRLRAYRGAMSNVDVRNAAFIVEMRRNVTFCDRIETDRCLARATQFQSWKKSAAARAARRSGIADGPHRTNDARRFVPLGVTDPRSFAGDSDICQRTEERPALVSEARSDAGPPRRRGPTDHRYRKRERDDAHLVDGCRHGRHWRGEPTSEWCDSRFDRLNVGAEQRVRRRRS